MFAMVTDNHSVNTRSASNLLLKVPTRRIKTTECGMHYFVVVTWKKIPLNVRNCVNLQAFKTQLLAEVFADPP